LRLGIQKTGCIPHFPVYVSSRKYKRSRGIATFCPKKKKIESLVRILLYHPVMATTKHVQKSWKTWNTQVSIQRWFEGLKEKKDHANVQKETKFTPGALAVVSSEKGGETTCANIQLLQKASRLKTARRGYKVRFKTEMITETAAVP